MVILLTLLNVLTLLLIMVVTKNLTRKITHRDRIIESLRNDFNALCAGASGVSGHLGHIDQQIKRITERQDQLDLRDSGDRTYIQAIKMIRQGATVNELMSACGLLQSEAELLTLLHSDKNKPSNRISSAA